MGKMRPIDYLTDIEKYLLKKLKEDINNCKSRSELMLIKNAMDELLKLSFERYSEETKV